MITTIYQKFISRYGETFTLVDMTDGGDYIQSEIIPAARVAKMTEEEVDDLFSELFQSENEKASWGEAEAFDEEDARAGAALERQEVDSFFDNMGM